MSRNLKEEFCEIYETNRWSSSESRSGKGSELAQTKTIVNKIPALIKTLGIESMLDIPCGDFNYMKEIDLACDYIGADIVEPLIAQNRIKYKDIDFRCLNVISDTLPPADLVLVRDCFVHLSNHDISLAIANIKRSGAKYLLVTSFPNTQVNSDLNRPGWRKLNMSAEPFNLHAAVTINENFFKDHNSDKSLILVAL
jgi:hypothetical protein